MLGLSDCTKEWTIMSLYEVYLFIFFVWCTLSNLTYTPAWWNEQVCLSCRRSFCMRPSRCLRSGSCSSEAAPGLGSGKAGGGGLGGPHGSREPPPWSLRMTTPGIMGSFIKGFDSLLNNITREYDKKYYTSILSYTIILQTFNLSQNMLQFNNMNFSGYHRKTIGQEPFSSRAVVNWPRHSQTTVQPEISICKRHHVPAQHSWVPNRRQLNHSNQLKHP